MPSPIAFGCWVPALLAGRKTMCRRDWADGYARRYHAGDLVAAYDHVPWRGRRIGTLEMTADPYLEWSDEAPMEDWEAMGLAYMEEHGLLIYGDTPKEVWEAWHGPVRDGMYVRPMWVLRFRLVEVLL